MKVKKYIAPSIAEAMKIIRAELGNDAVILNSKVVQTGGFLGFFKKRSVEVIAAVDHAEKVQPKVKEKAKIHPVQTKQPPVTQNVKDVKPLLVPDKASDELLKELTELKKMIKDMSLVDDKKLPVPKPLQEIEQLLINQDIDKSLRDELIVSLVEKWYMDGGNASTMDLLDWSKGQMVKRISDVSFGEITFEKKYVNVVGPTGVGKTTTLAKIAANCALQHKKKVAFITTDTYRIGAIEQLKTYAKILSIPLEVCYSLEDFKKACDSFKEFDVVLIDTAGRNFRNQKYVEDLKNVIDFEKEMETLLVLSLTSKQRDMEDIFKQFSIIGINKFIFTKADETSHYGAMFNLVDKYRIGVAYVTNGQDVPDDMIAVDRESIPKMILGVE